LEQPYPEQALKNLQKVHELAEKLDHPLTTCFTLYFSMLVDQVMPDPIAALSKTSKLLDVAEEHKFTIWTIWGKAAHGWASALTGNRVEGIRLLQQSQNDAQALGAEIYFPLWRVWLIDAYGSMLAPDEGLSILNEAIEHVDRMGERLMEAELYRLKGQFLLAQGDPLSAKINYKKSLEVAREQSAKWWELRTTTSLARLLQSQGKSDEAREKLTEIYQWFTEGFKMQDIQEAKILLDELS
jgi:predicted ATPase